MEFFQNFTEVTAVLRWGIALAIILPIAVPLLSIAGVRAFIGHIFKDILVDRVLKSVWGKRVATAVVCLFALGAAVWTGLWMFNGVSETAQVIVATHTENTRQTLYAELFDRVIEAGLAKSATADTGEAQDVGTLKKLKFWKKEASEQHQVIFSVSYGASTGDTVTAEAIVEHRNNMPGVLVTVHNVDDPKRLYGSKRMVFHIGQVADETGDTTWVLERDTITRRGFDNEEDYLLTAQAAVKMLLLEGCML